MRAAIEGQVFGAVEREGNLRRGSLGEVACPRHSASH